MTSLQSRTSLHAAYSVSPFALVGPASRRWAIIIAATLQLDRDVRTIDDWAREVGMGRAAIKCRCTNAGTSAKDSLDFARLLRVVLRHDTSGWPLHDVLDVVDPRTLRRLLDRAHIDPSTRLAPTLDEFLEKQTFVTSQPLIAAVRVELNR
jgi:hypothetical protein